MGDDFDLRDATAQEAGEQKTDRARNEQHGGHSKGFLALGGRCRFFQKTVGQSRLQRRRAAAADALHEQAFELRVVTCISLQVG